MIKLDKQILKEIRKEYPKLDCKDSDISATPVSLYNSGHPKRVNVHLGSTMSRSNATLLQLLYDENNVRVDEDKFYSLPSRRLIDRPTPESICWNEYPIHNLRDDMCAFHIITECIGSEQQDYDVLEFRYNTRGLLDRFPPITKRDTEWLDMFDLDYVLGEGLVAPKEVEMFNIMWKKFERVVKYIYNALPPKDCPSIKGIKNVPKKKPIYEFTHEMVKAHLSNDNWTKGNKQNIYKWIAIKYTFGGKFKTWKSIQDDYSTMASRKGLLV